MMLLLLVLDDARAGLVKYICFKNYHEKYILDICSTKKYIILLLYFYTRKSYYQHFIPVFRLQNQIYFIQKKISGIQIQIRLRFGRANLSNIKSYSPRKKNFYFLFFFDKFDKLKS